MVEKTGKYHDSYFPGWLCGYIDEDNHPCHRISRYYFVLKGEADEAACCEEHAALVRTFTRLERIWSIAQRTDS